MSEGSVHVIYDHTLLAKARLMAGGRLTQRQMMGEIASDARQAAPYQGQVRVEVETDGPVATVSIGPWWIGFLEIGSATHGARPFLEPAAERVFRTLVPKMKALGSSL